MSSQHTHAEWLALQPEQPLEPLLPIVDPHHHFFPNAFPAAFLESASATNTFGKRNALSKPYLLQELEADLAGNNVTHTVYMECHSFYDEAGPSHLRCVGETRKVQEIADAAVGPRVCAGIIAGADLSMGKAIGEVLDAHIAAGRNFVGVRDSCAYVPSTVAEVFCATKDPDKLDGAQFREGLAEVAARRLTYDCWLYHPQLPALVRLARDFPSLTIVCDHVAMPVGQGTYGTLSWERSTADEWRDGISKLAAEPNVVIKLGGLTMAHTGWGLDEGPAPKASEELAALMAPWYSFVIDSFGARRAMFESNFPMDKTSCSYTTLWNAFKRVAAARGCTSDEMHELFSGTAKRVYSLS